MKEAPKFKVFDKKRKKTFDVVILMLDPLKVLEYRNENGTITQDPRIDEFELILVE